MLIFSLDPITSAANGWGDNNYPHSKRLVSYEASVRVLAWNFDSASNKCRWAWNSNISVNQYSTETPRMIFPSPKEMDSVLVLVSVSVLLIQKKLP